MNRKPVLIVDSLTKIYERRGISRLLYGAQAYTAVDHISFSLYEREILGFLGPNGAGKTTTIQMLLSTLTPTSGTIVYFGDNLQTDRSRALQHVGFASAYVSVPRRLTVEENLHVYGQLYGMGYKERKKRMEELLSVFKLHALRNHDVGSLSAGETTRVMLAKAFLPCPKIALLDEPTASLDPDIAQEVRHFIWEQQERYGISILFASHNMYEVTEICDRVVVLQKGKVLEVDTPDNLARRISTAWISLLVGSSDLARTIEYVRHKAKAYKIEGHFLEIEIEEREISRFLTELAADEITYSQITIEKPTLEDYFLHIAKQQTKR